MAKHKKPPTRRTRSGNRGLRDALEQVGALTSRRRWPDARELLDKLIEEFPQSPEIYRKVVEVGIALEDNHFLQFGCERLHTLCPNDTNLPFLLAGAYMANGWPALALSTARRALAQQLKAKTIFTTPNAVTQYLQLHLSNRPYEVFAVLFVDAHNRMLALEEMFRGSLTQSSVYPREVVLRALHHQATAVVLAHNHPSGSVQPSRADEAITQTLQAALALLDIRVLDHVIVAPGASLSMAEQGLM